MQNRVQFRNLNSQPLGLLQLPRSGMLPNGTVGQPKCYISAKKLCSTCYLIFHICLLPIHWLHRMAHQKLMPPSTSANYACKAVAVNCRHFGKFIKIFGNIFEVVLALGKVLNLLWQFFCYWTNCHCSKWPKIEQTFQLSGHTAVNAYLRRFTMVQLSHNL